MVIELFCKIWTNVFSWISSLNKKKMLLKLFFRSNIKSTLHKKLAPNALQFTCWNLKSFKSHEKIKQKHKNAKFIDGKLKTKSRMESDVLYFFMWLARLQILMCEPHSIWRKLLVLSWLYLDHRSSSNRIVDKPMKMLCNLAHKCLAVCSV